MLIVIFPQMHTYNLAIIFGPTVIRSQNNDMVSLVADMSNQYKVVECLITKVNIYSKYCFCCFHRNNICCHGNKKCCYGNDSFSRPVFL